MAQSFVSRVRKHLQRFSPTERRLADLVLDFPGELASYSATELAKFANVSNATVTRFVRKVGYDSYEEARQHVRAERQTGAALFLVSAEAGDAADPSAAHLKQAQTNLAQTILGLSIEEIDAIARSMLKARRVWIVGFRAGRAFSEYLYWQLLQVVPPITLLPGPGETLGEYLAGMSHEDCVIVFGLRRPVGKLDAILDVIAGSGARIAYITDGDAPQRSGIAWQIRCQTSAPGPLFNHVSVLGVCHLMATRVIELAGTDGRRRLSAIEAAHDALREL